MMFEYDPERLIEEVRKRPGIWDFDDVGYRSKDVRHKLWYEIVMELLDTDLKITKSEKRELELQLQKKWKSIRDCFQKYSQNPNRTKRPYIYFKQLSFLTKGQDEGGQEGGGGGGGTSDSDDAKQSTVWVSKKKLRLVKNEETSGGEDDNDNDDIQYQDDLDFSNNSTAAKVPRTSKSIDEFAFASVDSKDNEDSDKMFLVSLLPHLKAIPEECRLDVKMDMMQVLRNAKYNAMAAHKHL